jgi:hypothetical protein
MVWEITLTEGESLRVKGSRKFATSVLAKERKVDPGAQMVQVS